MASQSEVQNYIKNNINSELIDDGLLKIIYDLGEGRSQLVYAFISDVSLNISSPFAKAEDVTPKQALKAVDGISFGIGMLEDWYVVRHVVPIADLDESEIITGLEVVAQIADDLEDSLVGGDAF